MLGAISHASKRAPDVILRRSFTWPSTVLAVIEGLGMRLAHAKLCPEHFNHSLASQTDSRRVFHNG